MNGATDSRAEGWLAGALGLASGATPFPWQRELLRRWLADEEVDALDIPTGLGKTAVMAIWLVALACGAKVPRRLVYVVDRRAVVDQATDVAEHLRAWVANNRAVAEALALDARGLAISTLRGQHVDNRAWLADPSAPAIVVGTVDMIGSRLLFAGYGVSPKMRPYHAGLLGADTLLVLDEAHLSQPFERLIEQIARGVDAQERSLRPLAELERAVPRFRALSLSATGRQRAAERTLGLTETDRQPGGVVAKRLNGRKRLSLLPETSDKELPDVLAREAWKLVDDGKSASRVIVFCTSRDHAQKVQDALVKLAKGSASPPPVLLVGERRVYEREQAARQLRELGFVAGAAARAASASFVIATAAGEVGVDLDAEHAVCDLVAWERMVQRLGRVNRRGDGDARIIVIPAPSSNEAEQSRREATRALLERLPTNGSIDVSLASLIALKEESQRDATLGSLVERATTPAPLHPPLTRALVEAWSMTSLAEHTGRPEVAPWIRGWPEEEEKPQSTLVWRAQLPIADDGSPLHSSEIDLFIEAASPHLAERLELETWRVLAWLDKRLKALARSVARAELGEWRPELGTILGVVLDAHKDSGTFVRYEDVDTSDKRKRFERTLAGSTLILDARIGGLRDGLLVDDANETAIDVSNIGEPPRDRVVPFRVRRTESADESGAGWRTEVRLPVASTEDGDTAWLVVESAVEDAAESEEGRSTARRAQLLSEHEEWTEAEARRIGERLRLSATELEILATAARLHDEGKKALRWQRAFHVPNDGVPPFAKSTTKRPNLALLAHYRHELGSLPHAEAHSRVRALGPEERELCLHLIAAHHGGARPVLRTDGAEEPPSRLALRARAIALRFAALEKQWGPWGLAWWESLLRAADQTASRRNDEEGGRDE